MKIGFSVILDTKNEDDVQKLAQLMQVFADQSSTVSEIIVSRAVRWEVEHAAATSADKVKA
ncbi:MAG: hypothetical protein [Bacteriophage sp.]|nr:MAG: hypothetical protein [Bacteriophage sp.]